MTDDLTPRFDDQDGDAAEVSETGIVSVESGDTVLLGQSGAIQIDKPMAGESLTVAVQLGESYVLNFDLSLAQVLQQGGDVVILFADGSQIVLEGLALDLVEEATT